MERNTRTIRQVRNTVRLVSYLAALSLVLGGVAWRYYYRSSQYERYVENSYHRAFAELAANIDGLNTSLQKSQYVSSPSLMSALCTDIYGKAMSAHMSLEALPFSNLPIENTTGFIARVGDYAYALSRMTSSGKKLGQEEYETLNNLYKTSSALSEKLVQTQADIYSQGLYLNEDSFAGKQLSDSSRESVSNTIQKTENDFPELPTLIYDGPFNEAIEKKEAVCLKGLTQISQAEAAQKTAEFLKVAREDITPCGDGNSKRIPVWCFNCPVRDSNLYIQVTKEGGKILNTFGAFSVAEEILTKEDAVKEAIELLEDNGYKDMAVSYMQKDDGLITINFAATKGDVILYPDLVKVKVALDDGSILGFDAMGYLMNHTGREIPAEKINAQEAESNLNPALSVLSSNLCMIPTAGGDEVFCREFKCKTKDDTHCLLYINAATGNEERILLLLENEDGTLTI